MDTKFMNEEVIIICGTEGEAPIYLAHDNEYAYFPAGVEWKIKRKFVDALIKMLPKHHFTILRDGNEHGIEWLKAQVEAERKRRAADEWMKLHNGIDEFGVAAWLTPNVELTGGALAPSSDRRERG